MLRSRINWGKIAVVYIFIYILTGELHFARSATIAKEYSANCVLLAPINKILLTHIVGVQVA